MEVVGHDNKSEAVNAIFFFLEAHCLHYNAAKRQV